MDTSLDTTPCVPCEPGCEPLPPRTVEAARAIPQIRAVGFDSVEAFVADTVRHIDSIWLPSKTSQLVTLQSEERGKAVFIELKPAESGDYYRVNTAFPTPRSYAEKKEQKEGWVKLWDRMALQSSAPAAQSLSAEQLSKDAGGKRRSSIGPERFQCSKPGCRRFNAPHLR